MFWSQSAPLCPDGKFKTQEWKISTGGSYLVKNPPTSMGFLDGSAGKESACNVGYTGDMGSILGSERPPPEKEMATHSSMLAWKIPWAQELAGLQSMGLQRVKHVWATNTQASNSKCIFSPIKCAHSTLNSKKKKKKNPPAMQETLVRFLGQEDPLEKR